jgi:hypothetical protein
VSASRQLLILSVEFRLRVVFDYSFGGLGIRSALDAARPEWEGRQVEAGWIPSQIRSQALDRRRCWHRRRVPFDPRPALCARIGLLGEGRYERRTLHGNPTTRVLDNRAAVLLIHVGVELQSMQRKPGRAGGPGGNGRYSQAVSRGQRAQSAYI